MRPERRERGGGRVVPRTRASVPRDPRGRRAHALEGLVAAGDDARGARRGRRRGPPRRRQPDPRGRPLTYAVAIFGLVFLILIHEAGPLRGRAARAHAAAEVLHLLPARDLEDDPQRDRVRHRRDPARRLREDPRDAPPGRAGPRAAPRPRRRGRSVRSKPKVAAAALALDAERPGGGARPAARPAQGGRARRALRARASWAPIAG